jgi:hypothetical protein
VRGTVTYQSPGNDLYIQDGDLALLIHAKAQEKLAPGTEIEAVGFAITRKKVNDFSFLMTGCLCKLMAGLWSEAKAQPNIAFC